MALISTRAKWRSSLSGWSSARKKHLTAPALSERRCYVNNPHRKRKAVGTVIKPDNIFPRYMQPALKKAGLRRFRFHDLRHSFGSLLIQDGASLPYVKEQMGHSSIQITVDVYGHLIPGANIAWVDRLDVETTQHQSAPGTHQVKEGSEEKRTQTIEKTWLPPRDSNPDMLIQSQLSCR